MKNVKNLNVNYEKINCEYGERKSYTGYASLDKPWLKYYPKNVENIEIPKMSIYQLLWECNKDNLNSTAMKYFGFPISYRRYFQKIVKYAKSLLMIGVKKGDIVALVLPNVPECRELIYALNIIGAVSYPISPMLSPNEFGKIVKENDIKTVFMFDLFYDKYKETLHNSTNIKDVVINTGKESIPKPLVKLSELKSKINGDVKKNVISLDYRNMSFSLFEKQAKKFTGSLSDLYEENIIAAIIGTSGTTGTSKGVCLTNENLNAMALQHLYGDMNFEKGDKLLDILIQSIGYGIAVAHYSGVCSLESVMVPELVVHILPYITKEDIAHFTGGPIHYENLLKDLELSSLNAPRLKNYVSGGASLSKEVEKKLNNVTDGYVETELEDENIVVRQGLGCTENGGAATYAKKRAYKFGGVGIPLAFETMSIFEPGTDKELKIGETGEICITGPTVMAYYLNNVEETEKVLKVHKDGETWLHTCDLGTIDDDGQVYITDRIKDIFMRKGFNVHPSKINEFIDSLPIVESSKVIGVSHPDEQMVPVLFVKLSRNMELEVAKEYIFNECFLNLEEPSVPYEIIFVDDMPRNLGGKIDGKYLLKISGVDYDKDIEQKILKLLKTNRQI